MRFRVVLAVVLPALAVAGSAQSGRASVEKYTIQRGSVVGPETKVLPTKCTTAPDGSVTCDIKFENAPGTTPAKPSYQPFEN
jgi:hypothetical protein